MITAICEVTAVVERYGVKLEAVAACPVFDNKTLKVWNGTYYDFVPFCEGIISKVETTLRGWFPRLSVSVSTRELPSSGQITCGDSHNEIVRDLLKTFLNSALSELSNLNVAISALSNKI